jgi:hypothetical protein
MHQRRMSPHAGGRRVCGLALPGIKRVQPLKLRRGPAPPHRPAASHGLQLKVWGQGKHSIAAHGEVVCDVLLGRVCLSQLVAPADLQRKAALFAKLGAGKCGARSAASRRPQLLLQ